MKRDIYNIEEWCDGELKELRDKITSELEYRKNDRLNTLKERVASAVKDLAEFVKDEHLNSTVGWVPDYEGGEVEVDIQDLLDWFAPTYG